MNNAAIALLAAAIGAGVATATTLYLRSPAPGPAGGTVPAGQGIRIIEAGSDSSGCDAGEELLGAYCYSTPPGSISASGVSFRKDAAGKMSLTCLTGGRQMRVFCMKPAK
jgi:hypothetical protein